jgi:hypothetical protein
LGAKVEKLIVITKISSKKVIVISDFSNKSLIQVCVSHTHGIKTKVTTYLRLNHEKPPDDDA